jgi:macrodomain Ter protein organizer (MatP/YcbG family)
MSVAWESFHRAVHELASSEPIKQRVTNAFSKHLQHMSVENLPAEIHSAYLELSSQLTRVKPLRGETAVWATVRKMSNEEAEAVARRIVQLLGDLAHLCEQPVNAKPRRVLSLYAAEA